MTVHRHPTDAGNAATTVERAGLWSGDWRRAEDGSVLVVGQTWNYDPETHVRRGVMIIERHADGRPADAEMHETTMRFWDVGEVTAHLMEAGFADAVASNVFEEDEPPGDHAWLVVRARKP